MTSGERVKYRGSLDCLRQIVVQEGVGALYRGCGVNVVRGVAGAGVLWMKSKDRDPANPPEKESLFFHICSSLLNQVVPLKYLSDLPLNTFFASFS